jgi:hypothetical protein
MRWGQWIGRSAWAALALGLALLWLAACAPGEVPTPPAVPPSGEETPAPLPLATPTMEAGAETPATPTPGERAFQSPLSAPLAATEEVPKIRAVEPPSSTEGSVRPVPPGKAVPGGPAGGPFRTLAQGRSTARLERPLLLVTDRAEGLKALAELVPDLVVSEAEAEVDFSQEVVIAALYGTPQGGAPVTIEGLRAEGREVEVLAQIPGAGARGPDVAPQKQRAAVGYHIVAFPKADLPRWSEQPLRFALRAVEDGVIARTIPLGPRDTYLEFDVLATGLAEGSGPGRTALYVAASAEDLKTFLPYIKDRSHRQVLNSVDWAQDVVVAVFQGRRAGQAAGVSVGAVRRAADWVVLHATFPRAAGLMLPEVGPYAYQVLRLRRADLPGWDARPYQFFLVGERLQQLATVEVQPGGKIQPLPGGSGASGQGQ